MKTLFLITILTTYSIFAYSQFEFFFSPEIGLSMTTFPKIKTYTVLNTDKITNKNTSLLNPIIGIKGVIAFRKNFNMGLGIQYEHMGEKYEHNRDGRIPRDFSLPEMYSYTHNELEIQSFHKICFPIYFGYSIDKWKIKPEFIIGIRPNYFISGKYYYKSIFDATEDDRDTVKENIYNPVSPDQAAHPILRFKNQVFFGLSTYLGTNYRINLSYCAGRTFAYSDTNQTSWEPQYTYFNNSEYTLSINYILIR